MAISAKPTNPAFRSVNMIVAVLAWFLPLSKEFSILLGIAVVSAVSDTERTVIHL